MSTTHTMYFPARRSLRERKAVKNHITGELTGTRFEIVGYETGRVEITVDFAALSRLLGEKAMKSKNGKSKMGHGAITVSVVRGSREQVRNSGPIDISELKEELRNEIASSGDC